MPEKVGNFSLPPNPWTFRSGPFLQRRFGLLTALVFVGVLVVWSIDGGTAKGFLDAWRFQQEYGSIRVVISGDVFLPKENQSRLARDSTFNSSHSSVSLLNDPRISSNEVLLDSQHVSVQNASLDGLVKGSDQPEGESEEKSPLNWVSVELEPNFTPKLLSGWLAPGGEACREIRTEEISIPGMDGKNMIELSAGDSHEFVFSALGMDKTPVCLGGDYFETDLSGESWKSRPPVKDFGNGSYSVTLQVHPDYTGDYNLTIILLYRHFEGLRFSPRRFVFDRELRKISVRFYKSKAQLPELRYCRSSDFSKDVWSGRWTRHERNDQCEISNDGRFRCLPSDLQCKKPWCDGSLGLLESNGWVYSAHCSFRIFSAEPAWNCLKNRWIFFWGDSNHVDTIRNMLNFVLDLPGVGAVPRRFDLNFTNPKEPLQTVRITSIFNGHPNDTKNYEGLDSLKDEGFRNLLGKYFEGETVPDTIIMNSGLHDGVHWTNIRAFSKGAQYAASFWAGVMESVRKRGLTVPKIFYRTTVATGGYARALAFNPSKMEAFNGVVLDKFKEAGLVSGVIDNFDMTFPWHYDNRCNDGVHYGRGPAKMKWRDGEIGHQYFVDLMLSHILLNALCNR